MLASLFRSILRGVAFVILIPSAWSSVPDHLLVTPDGSRLASYKDPLLAELDLNKAYDVAKGPWGKLQYYPIILSYPKNLLAEIRLSTDQVHWHFPETDPLAIENLLNEIGFPPTIGDRLWGQALKAWANVEQGGISFFPEPDLVLALTPETRAKLAEILRRSPVNERYINPIIIASVDAFSWYKDSGLDRETIELIDKLTYRWGNCLVWSDLGLVSSRLDTLEKRRTLVRATTRIRSLVLRIQVGGESDLSAISEYWSEGHKRKAVAPIFESIAGNPHVEYLDVVHLLPPVARRLLYTFPLPEDSREFGTLDCHWTAFNFFRSQSLLNNIRGNIMTEEFYERYQSVAVDDPLRYGDVIIFADPTNGDAAHSVVYIAGDIVYTKNGESMSAPWMFSRYGDILAYYGHVFPRCRIEVYRIK
ncbi:MAG: hypothetical protein ACSHX4_04875 [Opitutaceae bacterium]